MIPSERAFVLHTGEKIFGLRELCNALNYMDQLVFRQHVNDEKNDFYKWISNVFGDETLAQKINGLRNASTMSSVISIHLAKKDLERSQREIFKKIKVKFK